MTTVRHGPMQFLESPLNSVQDLADAVKAFEIVSTAPAYSPFRVPSPTYWALELALASSKQDPELLGGTAEATEWARTMLAQRLASAEEGYRKLAHQLDGKAPVWIPIRNFRGVVEHHVADQVVVVRSGTSFDELQGILKEAGQCIPIGNVECDPSAPCSHYLHPRWVGPAIDYDLPHSREAQCGRWRDWVLGMTVVRADGSIAKCGSQVVKNVAGYDVQKLLIGARGSLGIIAEVTLRTFPLEALPKPEVQTYARTGVGDIEGFWIQRTRRSDFSRAIVAAGERMREADRASCTLWAAVPPEESLPRYADDWVIRSGCGAENLVFSDPIYVDLMKRVKSIFDPTGKLNPGEMGIF